MLTAVESNVMAKKKPGRVPTGKREVTARVDVEVMRKVKYLASVDGVTIGEYLSRVLEPIVSKRYKDHLETELKKQNEGGKGQN